MNKNTKRAESDLKAGIAACRLCAGQLPFEPKPVLQWSAQARILIIGQAPGLKAHQTGTPFNDLSGQRLRSWLGVSQSQFYDDQLFALVPMGFCFPGTGRSGDLPPRPECAPAWREKLMVQMPHIQLNLLLGEYAQRWMLPQTAKLSLTTRLQAWRSYGPGFILLPHPSPRNIGWLKRHPEVEGEIIPALRACVKLVLNPEKATE